MRVLAALVLSLALVTGSQAKVPEIDPGGSIFERIQTMKVLEQAGGEVRISGVCVSACTMFLGLKNVCLEENSLLAFHSAAEYDNSGNPMISGFGNAILMLVYPPKIREWVKKKGALGSLNLTTMTSDEAYGLGVKKCVDDQQDKE